MCELDLSCAVMIVNLALTLPHWNKAEELKKRHVEHHLAILMAEVVDCVTPSFPLEAAAFPFLVAQRTVRRPGKYTDTDSQNAAEEKEQQVW